MTSFFRIFLLILVLFVPTGAFADGAWRKSPDITEALTNYCGTATKGSISSNKTCYHTWTGADTDSVAITIRSQATLWFIPNIATPGTDTATIRLWSAGTATVDSGTAAGWIQQLSGQILNGDYTATTQLAQIFFIPPGTYYIESVVQPGAEVAMIKLQTFKD